MVSKEVVLVVFSKYYDELCTLLSVILNKLMPELISKEVINHAEKLDIDSSSHKAEEFLNYMKAFIKISVDSFITFLDVLEDYGSTSAKKLSSSIKEDLDYRYSLQGTLLIKTYTL